MAEPLPALDVRVPQPQQGGANALDPFRSLEEIARARNELLTGRNLEATFAARQQLGQIYAQYGDDPDVLASRIAQSPASAFFPEAFTQAKSAALLGTQQAGSRQEMSGNIMKDWGMSMSTLYGNPTTETWLNLKNAALARAFDPKVKAAVSEQMDALGAAMFGGTNGNPEAVRKNIIANGIHFGMTPETAAMLGALPRGLNVGSGTQYINEPGIYGRTPSSAGYIPSGLPPRDITGPTTVIPPVQGGLPSGPGVNLAVPGAGPAVSPSTAGTSSVPPPNALMPGGGATLTAPTPQLSGVGQTYGTNLPYTASRSGDMAKYEKTLDTDVDNGATLYRNMSEIMDAAKKAHLGGGASAYAAFGKVLQAFGVNNDAVNRMANGDLAASQIADKLSLQNATSVMRQQLEGGGRYNMKEFVAFINSNPNLTTDPQAMTEIFNLWNTYYQRDKAEQSALNTAKGKPGFDMNTWPQQWQNSDYMKKFATGEPFTGEGVWGVLPPKGRDGVFRPRSPGEAKELPKGAPWYKPGDDESRKPRVMQ